MSQILSASAGARPSRASPGLREPPSSARLCFLELLSQLADRHRTVHGGKPNHRRRGATFDAAILVVPGLSRIVTNARLTTHRRMIPRFHNEAGLIALWHHQRHWAILGIGRKAFAAPGLPCQCYGDRT